MRSLASVNIDPRPRAAEPPAAAAPRLMTLLISRQSERLTPLREMVREALPGHDAAVCPDAERALARAEAARSFGWRPLIYLFDYRGGRAEDLAKQLRRVREAQFDAELVVLVEEADADMWRAALHMDQAPDRLTFLLCPVYRPDAIAALAAIAERDLAAGRRDKIIQEGERELETLKTQLHGVKAQLEAARHTARHDALTGVLNRAGFVEALNARLARGRGSLTMVLVDLDRFKAVNDTLGHHAGDELVKKICSAMVAALPAGAALGRLGGDEFGILIELANRSWLDEVCTQILRVCGQARRVGGGHEVQVTASIGVASQEAGGGLDDTALMRRADLALYAAKREGRNRWRVYDAALERATNHRLSIENGLERALRSGQFRMAYQPIVTARAGAVLGFEALVRWDSPEHGPVSPAEFVPVAEETGLILDLGDWIARQAFRDCRRWGGPYVSVNLSARQFLRQNVAERVLRYAEEADLAPERIQIELTETALIDDVERAAHNLAVLRQAGVRIALDDFGTGYSSLTYLNQFAIDTIKIDKSFVDNVASDRQSAVIVTSVTQLASSLGMGVVAEGVETEQQQAVLIEAGCGALQGYRFGKPMGTQQARSLVAGADRG
jgi:diguanylate cyclase (GGDEF)-like protein